MRTSTGVKDGTYCLKCGADLTKAGSVKAIYHIDTDEFFSDMFQCVKCGNTIEIRDDRKGSYEEC